MNITIGINVAGYTEYRITDDGLLNAKDSHILVYLDMESNAMLIVNKKYCGQYTVCRFSVCKREQSG